MSTWLKLFGAIGLSIALACVPYPLYAGPAPTGDFTVAAFSPVGLVQGRPTLRVSFSAPVVDRSVINKPVAPEKFPLIATPWLAGEGKWTDPATFVFTPLSNLARATKYRVMIDENLRDVNGRLIAGRQIFEFYTDPLRFLKARQVDLTQNNNVVIELSFSMPVSPVRIRGFLNVLNDKGQYLSYSVRGTVPAPTVVVTTQAYQGPKVVVDIAPGLVGAAGPMGLEKPVKEELSISRELDIREANPQSRYPEKSGIFISTSVPPDMRSLPRFIELSPKMDFTVEPEYNGFSIQGDFKPRQRVTVTIRKGLPAQQGKPLKEDFKKAFIFPDMDPAINFPASGTFLSPTGELRIPIETVNMEEVTLTLWRLYENNIPLALRPQNYDMLPKDLSRLVAKKNARIDAPFNETARRAINLRELAENARGLFLLTAQDAKGEYWSDAQQVVSVTDIGIAAKVYSDGITLWANSISGLTPIANASVRVYSSSNQLISEGTTDAEGAFSAYRRDPWDEQLLPSVVTVSTKDDVSYLKLDQSLLAEAGFDIGGRPYLRRGYEAFCFTPRGVFRPGEAVDIAAFVRDGKRLPPAPFPLTFSVRTSTGRLLRQGTAMLSDQGGATFRVELPRGAPTGTYSAQVSVPGDERGSIGSCSFHVEEFAAPRLEVSLRSDVASLVSGGAIPVSIASKYLFGAPASGLAWEGEVRFLPRTFQAKGWEAFAFGDRERQFEPFTDTLGQGRLDAGGAAAAEYEVKTGLSPQSMLDILFIVRVMEDGGRWVPQAMKIPFYPYPFSVGIEAPRGDISPQKASSFRVAAVTPDGKPAQLAEIRASLQRVVTHYSLVRYGNQTRAQKQEELVPVHDAQVRMSGGIGTYQVTPASPGEYLIRFDDPESGSSASMRFYAWSGSAGAESALLDRVVLKPDKERYAVGETAEIAIRSPFKGLLHFSVETDREVFRKIVRVDDTSTTVKFLVTEEMGPNAYCVVSAIRPVVADEEWGPHRAVGVVPIAVDQSPARLDVALAAPETIVPGAPLVVDVSLRTPDGSPVSGEVAVALVDEGVLSLTDFATPDPWAFFTARRALGTGIFDLYDQLMPLESRTTALLHPAGGAGEDAMAALRANLSPVEARRFRILSIFVPSLRTDASGKISTTIDIPEFSGKGRLMAIAVAGAQSGSAQRMVQIARDVVVEPTLPRAAAPGDSFVMPVKVFTTRNGETSVSLKVTTTGSLSVKGASETTVRLQGDRKDDLAFFTIRAGDEAGISSVTVEAAWGTETHSETTELAVRPSSPRVTMSGSGIVSGDSGSTIDLPAGWLRGTQQGVFVVGASPAVDLARAAQFLMSYPYGCLEQTISGAWPILASPAIAADIDPDLVNAEERNRAMDRIIRSVQALQLYDGSFTAWPGETSTSTWNSVYATHFLFEAKKGGFRFPDEVLDASLNWLKQLLGREEDPEADEGRSVNTSKAYASYVLALAGEAPLGWMMHLADSIDSLYPSGRLLLAAAYATANQPQVAKRILGGIAPSTIAPQSSGTLESGVRNNALHLLAWTAVDPMSAEAMSVARTLMSSLSGNQWRTTQENGMGVLALSRFLEKTENARKPVEATVKDASGKNIASMAVGGKASASIGPDAPSSLSVVTKGAGSVYYSWALSGVPVKPAKEYDQGIGIRRSFADQDGKPLAPGALRQGARIVVTLTITPSAPVENLVVADVLPAGFEIENPRLSKDEERTEAAESGDRNRGIRAEIRDDRLVVFIDRVAEPMVYRYAVRAVTKGTFSLPPVAAECMYNPGIRSLSGAGRIEIR
jgi:uncharacterized protein YfaS (alpha-2-macroglobulin family)